MSNRTFDRLKWVAMILLPSLGTLWFALAQIWNLPYAQEVLGTITALDTFLGAILGVSTASYKKGIKEGAEGLKNANTDEFFNVTDQERQEVLKQEE